MVGRKLEMCDGEFVGLCSVVPLQVLETWTRHS